MTEKETSTVGSNLGQILVLIGLILVYGGGSVFLCWELITDGKFAETGDVDDRIPFTSGLASQRFSSGW